jgi:hypothetical protein
MKRSEQIGELVAALAKAQAEFTPALKDSKNPYYNSKYADLSSVIGAVRPALNKHGIVLTQDLSADLERQVAMVKTGLYCGEQFFEIEIEAPAKGQTKKDEQSGVPGTKFDVQTIGAATLYLRRYSVAAICGLAAEDDDEDDGNSLGSNNGPISKQPACPNCGKDAVIKGKPEYGGGWVCYSKKGGCGAKFTDQEMADAISHQTKGEPAATQKTQPATQKQSTSPQASGRPAQSVKRAGKNLIFTVGAVKLWPAEGKVNASMNVAFTGKLFAPDGKWTCEYATCWHASLFDLIQGSIGNVLEVFVTERDKDGNHYIDINDVVSITDTITGEFVEYMDGSPVIKGDAQ